MSAEVKFLTIEQVAEMLQVTKMTIYNFQKKGLPFIKLGKNVRFDKDDVIEWVNSKKVTAAEQDK
jgi:excisionase family DNA binding protein